MGSDRAQMQAKAVFHSMTSTMSPAEGTVRFILSYGGKEWSITSRGVEYPLYLHKFKDELVLDDFLYNELGEWGYIMICPLYSFCHHAAQESIERNATTLELKVDIVMAHFSEAVPGGDRIQGEMQFRRHQKGSEYCCSVCLHDASEGEWLTRMDCGHEFHHKCLHEWLTRSPNNDCPLCRSVVAPSCEVDHSTWLLNSSYQFFP